MKLQELKKYCDYEFESSCYTTPDYLEFQNKYIRYLKKLFNEQNYKLLKVMKNHYEFALFFEANEVVIYLSITDVRYFQNEWFNHILIRTAKDENDYRGNENHYSNLPDLIENIKKLTEEK